MAKILIFCSDVVPVGELATSGGGMRSWQIIQGLLEHGHNVVYSIPQDRFLFRSQEDKIPQGVKDNSWNRDNQDSLMMKHHPDVVIFANPDLNYLRNKYDVPFIGDLHGPRLIEHKLLYKEKGPHVTAGIIRDTLEAYNKMDFFTCAGQWQQYYFSSWFLLGGHEPEDIKLTYMPVALSPQLPEVHKNIKNPVFIYGGGFYPWQNALPTLKTVAQTLDKADNGQLWIFGTHHNIDEEFKSKIKNFQRYLQHYRRVRFFGSVPRKNLLTFYSKGLVAVDLMEKNLERQICFPTRTIEYLWAGLPVIFNNYSELSADIREYDAGWTIDPADENGLQEICREILADPEIAIAKGKNAQRLVKDKFTWDKVIEPVLDFIESPRINNARYEKKETLIPYLVKADGIGINSPTQKLAYKVLRGFEKLLPGKFKKLYMLAQAKMLLTFNLVDLEWYLANNQDVKMAGMNPAKHYALYGWKEGRNPRPDFSTSEYLEYYPMLRNSFLCPPLHQKIRNSLKRGK